MVPQVTSSCIIFSSSNNGAHIPPVLHFNGTILIYVDKPAALFNSTVYSNFAHDVFENVSIGILPIDNTIASVIFLSTPRPEDGLSKRSSVLTTIIALALYFFAFIALVKNVQFPRIIAITSPLKS